MYTVTDEKPETRNALIKKHKCEINCKGHEVKIKNVDMLHTERYMYHSMVNKNIKNVFEYI